MEIFDALGFLLGSWRVQRHIEDRQIGISGAFKGVATFVQHEGGGASPLERKLRFHETGELDFGTFSGHSERCLEYIQHEGTQVRIYFASGRPFIDLDLSGGRSRSTHLCDLDTYEISFLARSDDVLEENWQVQGPMKNYVATATLRREVKSIPPEVAPSSGDFQF